MNWIGVTVYTTNDGIDPLCGIFYQLGINGIEIEDETDFNDFLENNKQSWDYIDQDLVERMKKETTVKVYVSDNLSGHELLSSIKAAVLDFKSSDTDGVYGRLEIELSNISEEDWANNWKQYFHPTEVGEKILIKPEWEELSEPTDRIVFNVNPGMSFGTGSHETTQLCIEALEKVVTPDSDILDLGCGSGILSIISLLLGAKSAYAVDIDPNAVDIAFKNAAMNNIDMDSFTAKAGNILTDKPLMEDILKKKYPVVCANIVADVIIALLPFAKKSIADNGTFITSGIILDRLSDVEKALNDEGFSDYTITKKGEWASIVCKKG